MMRAEIIVIGDEILIGQVLDTNSGWIAAQLFNIGVSVTKITTISDTREAILNCLKTACNRADLVLITGGLGPTKDDITKKVLCEFFDSKLAFQPDLYEELKQFMTARGRPDLLVLNRSQAEIPANCTPISNRRGTAPGMWFKKNNTAEVISMPGVPSEMKGMMIDTVIPKLIRSDQGEPLLKKTILTIGVAESELADQLHQWETGLGDHLKLAYLPSPGMVRLRLTGAGLPVSQLRKEIDRQVKALQAILKEKIFGYDEDTLEQVVGRQLLEQNATVSTAESCTGGAIAGALTSVPGSSAYYKGSIVSYSNDVKASHLDVPMDVLETDGAVSQKVVEQMVRGVLKRMNTDYGVATSGIAGPTGGTADKPVGTTWIAVGSKQKIVAQKYQFGNGRGWNVRKSTVTALNMLRNLLTQEAGELK